MFQILASKLFLSVFLQWALLLFTLLAFAARKCKFNPLVWGTYTFINDYFTNDTEEWTFTTALADTVGVLTFKNTDYKLHPRVHLAPTAASTYANSIFLGTPLALGITVTQTVSIGAGAGRIIVERRR